MKNTLILLITFVFCLFSFNVDAGSNWKVKLNNNPANLTGQTIKIYWYCDGKKMDADTVGYLKKKTRELSYSKCKNGKELTVKFKAGKYPFPIQFGDSFANGFFGAEEFKYWDKKHCFTAANNILTSQPVIKKVSC